MERTAATATAMQKGEEPISEPNWAAERPFVRSPVGSTWKCGSSCFQTRMGERGRKEGEREGARMGAPILQRDRSDHHQNHKQPRHHHHRHESQSLRHGFDEEMARRAKLDLISHQSTPPPRRRHRLSLSPSLQFPASVIIHPSETGEGIPIPIPIPLTKREWSAAVREGTGWIRR